MGVLSTYYLYLTKNMKIKKKVLITKTTQNAPKYKAKTLYY